MGEKDVFRDTPVRYLGYANELGESFRSVIDVKWVNLSYVVASCYVLSDTASKAVKVWKTSGGSDADRSVKTAATAADVLIWQSFASVIIPGFTINRICAATRFLAKKTPAAPHAKWVSVGAGLLSIPLIIKPIDHAVDYAMDKTLRPVIGTTR